MKKPSLPTFEEEEMEGKMRTLTFGDRTISYDAGMDYYDQESRERPRRNPTENDASDDQADDGIGTSDDDENSLFEENSTLKSRTVIKPDPSLIGQLMNFDEEEEDEYDEEENDEDTTDAKKSNKWQKTVAKDLLELSPRSLERRHSISLCMSPNRRKNSYSSSISSDTSKSSVSHQSSVNDEEESYLSNESSYENGNDIRTCELQLEEVAHIRSVLTKAELETLPMDNNIRENVQRGKVCYVCLKTKFGLFYRGQRCDMCKQMVCANCYSKTRIPIDHFKSTPVFTLSPSIQGSLDSYPSIYNNTNNNFTSLPPSVNAGCRKISPPCFINKTVGSAPSSPESSRKAKAISTISETIGPSTSASRQKYATLPKNNGRRISSVEARELEKERLEGHLLNICTDCKGMVLQVIRASSNRRVKQGINAAA